MKDATKIADLGTLLELHGVHDAGYEALKLERAREIYGVLYRRMQDLLHLDEEGYQVSITLRGPSRTINLTPAEAEKCFNFSDIFEVVGSQMNARHAEIIDTLLNIENGTPLDSAMEGTGSPLMREALALCLPQVPKATQEVPATTSPAV